LSAVSPAEAADTLKPTPDRDEAHADRSLFRSRVRGDRRARPGPAASRAAAASPAGAARSAVAVRRAGFSSVGRVTPDNPAAPRGAGDVMISDVDKGRIAEAIRTAEEKTAGEIFCVIAHACGDYQLVPIAWAALVGFAVPLPLIFLTARPAGIIYLLQL